MTMTHESKPLIEYYPARDSQREPLGAPIDEITVLEDRAQVRRIARPRLQEGHHKLFIEDVSPIIQDVSLRARVTDGRGEVADIKIQRAMKSKKAYHPKEIRELEEEIEATQRQWQKLTDDQARITKRAEKLKTIITLSTQEIPEDVAWGDDRSEEWSDSLEKLFETHRKLVEQVCTLQGELTQTREHYDLLQQKRALIDRPDQKFVAWIELDVIVNSESSLTIEIDYVTPNAMWRPVHNARLDGDVLTFTSKAALWQNTGEDWNDVQLIFSTAQSSLGTEPPLLHDDVLNAQRKQEETTVEMREVAIQQASVDGGSSAQSTPPGAQNTGVDLQGVDDGGDIQNLRAPQRVDIPSDGEANFIDIFEFKALSEVERLLVAELTPYVVLRAVQRNTSKLPVLAGPVELLLQGGPIGWTKTLFVAPGERFELGFGPDESLRAVRDSHLKSQDIDPHDKWTHKTTMIQLFLSNLSTTDQQIVVKERVPVSEIEKVKVFLLKNKTTEGYVLDDDGIVVWNINLPAHTQQTISMEWRLSMAPDVQTST